MRISRALCLFGLHDWSVLAVYKFPPPHGRDIIKEECDRCGRMREATEEQKSRIIKAMKMKGWLKEFRNRQEYGGEC
jgi:hypothetical protein